MASVEVLAGPERRRRWSAEQKRAIVAAAFAPGAVVREVARRPMCAEQIYRWRQDLRSAASGFAEVVVAPGAMSIAAPPSLAGDRDRVRRAMSRARIPASVSPALAAAVVEALARR